MIDLPHFIPNSNLIGPLNNFNKFLISDQLMCNSTAPKKTVKAILIPFQHILSNKKVIIWMSIKLLLRLC